MARYFLSYDLNGSTPTHSEMDKHLEKSFSSRQRILETVWFVCSNKTTSQVFDYVNSILSNNDRLIVIEANSGVWRNLLGGDQTLLKKWNECSS